MSLSIGDTTSITGLFQKKSKRVVEDMLYFSENPLFLEKTSFHPRKFCKNVWYPLEVPRSKAKTQFHMSSPWKSTSFLIDSRNFHMSFTTPGNSILSTTLYVTWGSCFFSKRRFYGIVYTCCIWLILPFYYNLFLFFMIPYLSFISYFCNSMFYTRNFFSIFVKDFSFSSFPFNTLNIWKILLFF